MGRMKEQRPEHGPTPESLRACSCATPIRVGDRCVTCKRPIAGTGLERIDGILARELGQMQDTRPFCPACGGKGGGEVKGHFIDCDPCHGEGRVWPDEVADIERRYPR